MGKNRVARLMKVAGQPRRKTRTTLRGQDSRPAPDLVERNFQVSRPNRLGADITYVPSWAMASGGTSSGRLSEMISRPSDSPANGMNDGVIRTRGPGFAAIRPSM